MSGSTGISGSNGVGPVSSSGHSSGGHGSSAHGSTSVISVLLYSQHAAIRNAVRSAVGRRPAPELGRIDWIECDTYAQVKTELDAGDVTLAIFDGEAQPTGGMGLARQFKNELSACPPIIVLVGRTQDRWLASWSLADAVLVLPIDPVAAVEAVAKTLRSAASAIPVVR